MPRLSVVIPIHQARSEIRTCLDSVLDQSFRDLEVIAVDDRSPQGIRDVLDDYALRDPRVRVIRLQEPSGPGPARNEGARVAWGEYLLFLDCHDYYLPGSLAAIAERLEEAGDPDLLIFEYVHTHRGGRSSPGVAGKLLSSTEDEIFTLGERPEMIRLPAVIRDKAFRTRFWWENEFAFPPGLYEDSPIAYETLMAARAIACLKRPCLRHHPYPDGSVTVSPSRRHFDIFVQYAGVYAYIEQHPELDDLRDLVFHRMIDHFLSCLERTSRVRPSDRRVYFRRIKELYRRYRPDRMEYPSRLRGMEFRLVELGLYTPYAALKAAQATHFKTRSAHLRLRHLWDPVVHELYRRFLRLLPTDDHVDVLQARQNRRSRGAPTIEREPHPPTLDLRPLWVPEPDELPRPRPDGEHALPHAHRS